MRDFRFHVAYSHIDMFDVRLDVVFVLLLCDFPNLAYVYLQIGSCIGEPCDVHPCGHGLAERRSLKCFSSFLQVFSLINGMCHIFCASDCESCKLEGSVSSREV